ncbi:MAG TPA: hypothetical protein VIN09_07415 [Chloroflexota bacterium]|jgi:hypothetical protein
MIFIDYYAPAALPVETRRLIQREVGEALRARPEDVVLRRIVAETDYAGLEFWVELSSEEQLYRYGREVARRLTTAVRGSNGPDVWVMFKVVPLAHAFLNGEARGRGLPGFE